jgi:hypothetical protein
MVRGEGVAKGKSPCLLQYVHEPEKSALDWLPSVRVSGVHLGTQPNGWSVFLDLNTRVVSIVEAGGNGVTRSIHRVASASQCVSSMAKNQTVLPPGLTWQQVERWLLALGAGN